MEHAWYSTGLERVRAVRVVLGDSRHGVDLDERIAALVSTGNPALSD
jgi:hypothetical protein